MAESFDRLKAAREAGEQDERDRARRESEIIALRVKAAEAISPMVTRVLERFRKNVLPNMDTRSEINEKWQHWSIGFIDLLGGSGDNDPYESEVRAVWVFPRYSPDGQFNALETCLVIPDLRKQGELCKRHGFIKEGSTDRLIRIRHGPTQHELEQALISLFPPEFLKELLVATRDNWSVYKNRPASTGTEMTTGKRENSAGCAPIVLLYMSLAGVTATVAWALGSRPSWM